MNIPDSFSNTGIYCYDLRVAENISFGGGRELEKKKREGKGLREREEEGENR